MRVQKLFVGVVAVLGFCSVAAPASASVSQTESESVAAIRSVAPEMLESFAVDQVGPSTPRFASHDSIVEFDSATHRFALSSAIGSLKLGLPDESAQLMEAGGFVSASMGPDAWVVPLTKEDGSLQIALVMEDEKAPTSFEFALDLPAAASAKIDESGAVIVTDEIGSFVAGISAPWARDAAGEAVPTRFDVHDGKLVQIVDHRGAFQYPIVADPWAGQNLLQRAWVSNEPSGYVINAVATTWGRTFNGPVTHGSHVAELKQRLGAQAYRVN